MRLPYLFLLFPLFLIVACSSTPPVVNINKQPITIIKNDFAKIYDNNFKGLFYIQDEQAYFKRCGSEQAFSVNSNMALITIYKQITDNKLVPVYIEFTGEIIFSNKEQSSTDVVIRIDRVFHMELAETSLQCSKPINTFRFQGKGESPYWRLNIDGQKLYFATKVRNQAFQIQDANFQTTQLNRVKSMNKLDEYLNLTIKPGDCYNLEKTKYWGYTASVDMLNENFKGCGESGWPTIEQKFNGYYLSKTNTVITNLTLNEDYTVEYNEKIGKRTILKTGFWKSNSPDRVVIMLTRRANRKIKEELILKRNGLTLSTLQLNNNHIITTFDAPGLIFKKMNIKKGTEEVTSRYTERTFTPQLINPSPEIDLDIQAAVNQYFKIHRTDPQNTKFNTVKFDLNGDGIEEAIVLLDWCSKDGCEMLVFKGKENGYSFSSRVSRVKAPITVAKTRHYLWQSLLTQINRQSFKLDFDGISYPIQTRNLKEIDINEFSTGVVLFSQGTPFNWFPVK